MNFKNCMGIFPHKLWAIITDFRSTGIIQDVKIPYDMVNVPILKFILYEACDMIHIICHILYVAYYIVQI